MQKILKLVKTDQNLTKILEADCRRKLHKVKPAVPGPGTIWGNAIKKQKIGIEDIEIRTLKMLRNLYI